MNSRRWIVLGTLLLICSVLIIVIGVVFSLSRFNMKQVLMPGTVEFTMDTPGPFFLAYEPRTDTRGRCMSLRKTRPSPSNWNPWMMVLRRASKSRWCLPTTALAVDGAGTSERRIFQPAHGS